MRFYAHSREGANESEWQALSDHLLQVAGAAGSFAADFGAGEWGFAAGLRHDLGKASLEYQARLKGDRRKVDHSTAGARQIAGELKLGNIPAACIAGHHGGLPDGLTDEDSCLAARLRKEVPKLAAIDNLPGLEIGHELLPPFKLNRGTAGFQLAFFTRMLFSCLVDADFLDTERFLDPQKTSYREGFPEIRELCERFSKKLWQRFADSAPTEINRRRDEILRSCIVAAAGAPGLFSLTVPTGGGKTLSSLAFALEHARRHRLKRIVYVIPFTGIIEQNAEVFRDLLGDDAIVEHHSAFDFEKLHSGGSEDDEALHRIELASENWDAPIIVTTAVQFFESLFSSKPSRCRKLHNLAKSAVILDEAQMLPIRFLVPCVQALQELAANYGASLLLCTATQPSLQQTDSFKLGLSGRITEIIDDPRSLYESFRRVRAENGGKLSLAGLAALMKENRQILAIVSTRSEARMLFEMIGGQEGASHLSALMCPEHRSLRLAEIKKRLKEGRSCRLVSTSLIEAGVDIDFPVVLRAIAGIDSIAQAAGRCNREGKLGYRGRVIIYTPEGKVLPLEFRPPAEAAEVIMRKHADPLSLDAVDDYFKLLYWKYGDRLDEMQIIPRCQESWKQALFPFRSIDKDFQIISEAGEALIIPFDDKARGLIDDLRYSEFHGRILRRCQRYTVQVYTRQMKKMEAGGAVERVHGTYPVLREEFFETYYRQETGLYVDEGKSVDPGALVI